MNLDGLIQEGLNKMNQEQPFDVHRSNRLIVALSRSGLTLEKVAEGMHVSQQHLAKILYGSLDISPEESNELCVLLNQH